MENPDLTARLREVTEEKKRLTELEEALQKEEERKARRTAKRRELREWMVDGTEADAVYDLRRRRDPESDGKDNRTQRGYYPD